MAYIIVSGNGSEELVKNVNEKTKDGYKLVGTPFTVETVWYQALRHFTSACV